MSGKRVDPNLADILDSLKKDIFFNLNCHRVGIIQSFDESNQTAKIKLVDKRVIDKGLSGQEVAEYSLLVDCPVVILKGQRGGLTCPITPGDTCLVLFNDRNIDKWFTDGLEQPPEDSRSHNLSDGIALVGIRSLINPVDDYDNEATEINFNNTKIKLNTDIQLAASSGAVLELTDKIKLSNDTQNLKTLLDNLIDAIINLTVLDPISGPLSLTGASNIALTNIKGNFDQLLKS